MNLGIVLGVASLVTLRFYVHVAPVWVVLVASGAAALLATLAVRRLLASGPGGERDGFTAEPLFEDRARRHATEIVGTMAAFAPRATAVPADGRPDAGRLEPGGGRYGGEGRAATSEVDLAAQPHRCVAGPRTRKIPRAIRTPSIARFRRETPLAHPLLDIAP